MIPVIGERAVVYGLLAAICFGAGWKVNGWRLGEGIAQERLETVRTVRVSERAQQKAADTEGQKGHDELEDLRRSADDARAYADGLRKQAGSLAAKLSSCNAGIAGEREAREAIAAMFVRVLGEMEEEGRGMAEAADRARTAGLTCERTYEAVKAINGE